MTNQTEKASSMVKRQMVLMIAMALVLVLGVAGAGKTAYWSLRFGLTPRPPLSMFETIPRYAAVITALFLAWARKDSMERSALICAVIAASSSGLDGLGINSVTLQVVRLLFHFLAYKPWGVGHNAMVSGSEKRSTKADEHARILREYSNFFLDRTFPWKSRRIRPLNSKSRRPRHADI